jgi:hypothetical protein
MRLGHVGEGVGGVRGRTESVLWVRVMVRYMYMCMYNMYVCGRSVCTLAVSGRVRVLRCRGRVRGSRGALCVPACARLGVSRALEPACPCRVVPCLNPPHLPLVVRCDLGVSLACASWVCAF